MKNKLYKAISYYKDENLSWTVCSFDVKSYPRKFTTYNTAMFFFFLEKVNFSIWLSQKENNTNIDQLFSDQLWKKRKELYTTGVNTNNTGYFGDVWILIECLSNIFQMNSGTLVVLILFDSRIYVSDCLIKVNCP